MKNFNLLNQIKSPASCIMHHASCFLHPASCILHRASSFHHASCIMHRASRIMHPASCIMHHASQGVSKVSTSSQASSFHHASCILNRESFMRFAAMLLMLITMSVGQVWADMYISGDMGLTGYYWGIHNELKFVNNKVILRNVLAGTYEFKVTNSTSWSGDDLIESRYSGTLTSKGKGNDNRMRIALSAASDITITWQNNGWKIAASATACDPAVVYKDILDGSKIMFYYGVPQNYGGSTVFLLTSDGNTKIRSAVGLTTFNSNYKLSMGIGDANTTSYRVSDSENWNGESAISGFSAGCMGICRNNTATPASTTFAFSSTSASMSVGDAATNIPAITPTGTSGAGLAYSTVSYFCKKDGSSTWKAFDINDGSSLEVGTYKVKALISDGNIFVSSTNEVTLTVNYVPQNITVYYSNPNSWNKVYYHAWGGNAASTNWNSCPEVTETVVRNCTTFYKLQLDAKDYKNFLFKDASGNPTNQTGDLSLSENDGKYYDGTNWHILPDNTTFSVTCASGTGYEISNLQVNGSAYTSGTNSLVCGDVVTFHATAALNYEITSVKNGEEVLVGSEGNYTITTTGTGNITINVTVSSTLVPQHLVRFLNSDGTTVLQSGRVEEGQTPSYTGATPTKASDAEWDYTFAGWNKDIAVVGTEDVDYTATYNQTRRQYTLTWNLDGGTAGTGTITPAGSVANGTVLQYTENPTKTGYTFNGWNPAMTSGTTTMPTNNQTYTAKWQAKQSRVTIDKNGGQYGCTEFYVDYGTSVAAPGFAAPVKDGSTFLGYFDDAVGGKKYYNADGTSAATWDKEDAAVTLYAHWAKAFEQNEIIYLYLGDNTNWTNHAAKLGAIFYQVDNPEYCLETSNANYGASNIGNIDMRQKHFGKRYNKLTNLGGGWYSIAVPYANAGGVRFVRMSGDDDDYMWGYADLHTASDQNGRHTVKLTNNADNETTTSAWSDEVAEFVNSGWYLMGSGTFGDWSKTNLAYPFSKSYRNIPNFYYRKAALKTNINDPLYFRIHDTKKEYSGDNTSSDYTINKIGDIVPVVENGNSKAYKYDIPNGIDGDYWFVLNATGKKFWIQAPADYYNVTVTGADAHGSYTLKDQALDVACAQYSDNDTYVLTVTPATGYVPSVSVNSGEAIAMTDNQDGTYTYSASPVSGAVELVVSYTRYYTVTFGQGTVKGGGRNAVTATGDIKSPASVPEGTEITFTRPAPTTGYTFIGWFDNQEATGDALGTESTYTTTISANTNVYAVYAYIPYVIHYELDGGTNYDGAPATYTIATATIDLGTPTKDGYFFQGWFSESEFTNKVTQIVQGTTGNKTFYAKWDPVGYYLNINLNPGGDADWQKLYFEGGTLELQLDGRKYYEFSLLKRSETQEYWYGIDKDGGKTRTIESDANWYFYSGQANVQLHTTIDGKYVLAVTDGANPQIQFTYPQFDCTFNIPDLVNTLQPSTFTFTPTVVNFGDVTYELYYKLGEGEWTSCAGVSESAGVYSYNNTFATAGTYQLKVVVKNGTEQVGEPFLSSEFTVVAPTIELSVSSYPRTGAEVTVTPTVTGVSGTYYYCWSLLKNGEAQDVTFTEDGEHAGSYIFTAPEAGTYTLRLEVKPGENCEGAAIISTDKELTILGNSIVVKMKRDPYTYWELDNYIYYYKGLTENHEWPGEKMTYLGKDAEGFPWYSFVINNFNTYNGGTLVFNENKRDKNASQTQDIAMPQTDACYFVSASLNNEWKRKATLLQECPDTEARVLLTSATTNLYQNVTYTVKAQVVFLPGDEFTYSCTITDPSSQTVTLDEHNSFIPSAVGTYHIVLRATNEVGTYAETAYDLTFAENPITLALSDGKAAGLDNVITLTTSSTHALNDTYKYTYTVIEPGTHDEVTFQKATTNATTSTDYTMRSTGTYLFFVHITDASGNTVGRAQCDATVASMKCWIKHDWNGGGKDNWYWHEMTYREDGTYKYYSNEGDADHISSYRGDDGANVVMSMTQPLTDENYLTINNPYNLSKGADAVVYIYDAAANTLEVRPAGETTVYRIKSTCSDGVYYSNTVNNASEKLSFYAQKNGSLQWQYRQSTADDWIDGTVISTDMITKNTVYQATVSALGTAALVTCKAYTGAYYVYTAAAPNASAQMTAFTKSPLQSNEYYNHYYTVHQTDNCNLMATVGNAINHNLSVVLPYYKLPREANVRYGYDDETNLFVRACIDNSTTQDFLMLYGNNLSTIADDPVTLNGADNSHMLKLTDVSDWIYTCTVRTTMASENPVPTKACLRTVFDGKETWILAASGLESDEDAQVELLNDRTTSAGTYDLNIIYDYKTNRLVAGWTPEEDTIFDKPIMVDQMLISRVGDGAATQFEIKENNARQNEILVVKQMTLEFVFNKSEWQSSWSSTNGSVFYWISVPYECRVSDIFGLGAYKGKWEIQDYRGDMLAKGTAGSTPWRILNLSSTMKPNHGYVLRFFGLVEGDFKTVGDISAIRMYFPSHQSVELTPNPVTELPVNENAKTNPSQWDWCVAGVPLMKSGGLVENELPDVNPNNTDKLESYYKWEMNVTSGERWYEPVLFSGYDEEPMLSTHGYMVQGIGSLVWTYPTNIPAPSPVQARRTAISTTNMDIRLDLMRGGAYQDRTYVLYREDASRDFELGRDMPKIENAGRSMVWSAMDHNLATNVIADDDYELIPLTVVAAENGEYTIHLNYMEGGDDMQPILYDAVEGTTTMMRYQDHTIELNAGKYENRFFVGLRKAADVVTGLENVGAEADGVQKLLYDGKLYIVTDGHIFDATGRQIK